MSTTKKVSKSRLAFDYLSNHADATAGDVVAALEQHDVKISDVNNAKQKIRQLSSSGASKGAKKRSPKKSRSIKTTASITAKVPGKRGPKPRGKTRTTKALIATAGSKVLAATNGSAFSTLEAGVRFIESAGSIENARDLLSLIEQIKKN